MQHYKAPDNSLHVIDPEFSYLLPAGCVAITKAETDEIRASQNGANEAQIIEAKKSQIRVVREGILNRLAGIALAAQLEGDTDTASAYLVARQGLLDITKNLPTNPADVDAVVLSRYGAIVGNLPENMVSAFAGVDM